MNTNELITELFKIVGEVTEDFNLNDDEVTNLKYICIEAITEAIKEVACEESKNFEPIVKEWVFNKVLDYIIILKLM